MEEYPKDTDWTNILHKKEIHMEHTAHTQGAVVGELIVDQLMRDEPAYQDTGEEPDYRQEYLACHKVEDLKQRLTQELQDLSRSS